VTSYTRLGLLIVPLIIGHWTGPRPAYLSPSASNSHWNWPAKYRWLNRSSAAMASYRFRIRGYSTLEGL